MIGSTAGTSGDLIEDYLDRLLVSLSGSPRQVRHTLAEVEAHLRDAVAEGMATGLSEDAAQTQALERIGPVHVVAGRPAVLTRPSAPLLRHLVLTARLGGSARFLPVGGAGLARAGPGRAGGRPGTAQALGAVLAGLAAIVCFGQVADAENVKHGIGAGEPLSLAIAATSATAVFALALRQKVRSRTS